MKVMKVRPWAMLPVLGTEGAAGFDVTWCGPSAIGGVVDVRPGQVVPFGTGLAFEIPDGMAMLLLPRSGLAIRQQLRPANTPGLIDPDYRGELIVGLENFGVKTQHIHSGTRIAQILFVPFIRPQFDVVEELGNTIRGEGGFGSTGVQ